MLPAGTQPRFGALAICVASGFLLAVLYFLATWHIGINLADEGFYWYGAQRVFQGEVPIRDFMSYDPGRYYIAAFIMAMVGNDGIWAARAAAYLALALLAAIGVYLALLAFHGNRMAQWCYSLIVALLLIVWTYPYFRTFDFLAATLLILAVTVFIRQRTPWRWFLSGMLLGLVAVIGRNHGVYGVIGFLVALAMIHLDRGSPRPGKACYFSWAAGVVAGYLPVLLLMLFVDGFARVFFEGILFMVNRGTTNIVLSVPWPWLLDIRQHGLVWSTFHLVQGIYFLGLLAFPVVGLGYVFLARRIGRPLNLGEPGNAVLLASVSLALPYAHYAYSRADVVHLAASVLPLLFGLLSLPMVSRTRPRMLMAVALLASALVVMADVQTPLRYLLRTPPLETYAIGPDKILVPVDQAAAMRHLDRLVEAELDKGEAFLALPNFMTLHAIHHQRMAVREIYSLFFRTRAYEEKEIARIAALDPTLVIVSNHALDQKEALRYSRTHPVIYQWLNNHYQKVDNEYQLEIYRKNNN